MDRDNDQLSGGQKQRPLLAQSHSSTTPTFDFSMNRPQAWTPKPGAISGIWIQDRETRRQDSGSHHPLHGRSLYSSVMTSRSWIRARSSRRAYPTRVAARVFPDEVVLRVSSDCGCCKTLLDRLHGNIPSVTGLLKSEPRKPIKPCLLIDEKVHPLNI